uniref:Cyclin N-terminal domain-containing protein n=1 Tax=Aplanochytrium stocchinoi TaxID=215587 RepID=A0A6S8FHB6_9STRA|mmetsp:Transcript_8217/g.10395  ORF Transcript_8217/g.10395 Transcript_8217/m.10395 type:complete len:351 (+) Transcript_8217:176-1228(+)
MVIAIMAASSSTSTTTAPTDHECLKHSVRIKSENPASVGSILIAEAGGCLSLPRYVTSTALSYYHRLASKSKSRSADDADTKMGVCVNVIDFVSMKQKYKSKKRAGTRTRTSIRLSDVIYTDLFCGAIISIACKVEEKQQKLRDICNVLESVGRSLSLALKKSEEPELENEFIFLIKMPEEINEEYTLLRNTVNLYEQCALEWLQFSLDGPSSPDHLVQICNWLSVPLEISRLAWTILHDFFLCSDCIIYEHPRRDKQCFLFAAACAYIALTLCLPTEEETETKVLSKNKETDSQLLNMNMLEGLDGETLASIIHIQNKEWWALFGVSSPKLKEAVSRILDFYEKERSRK